jgi:hypothetical protein
VPPRGWRYPQVLSSGQTVEIIGYSFEQLLENLAEFRRRHPDLCGGAEKALIETVRSDYREYVCKHFRQNCASGSSTSTVQTGSIGVTNYVSPINKAADWLAQIGQNRLEHVDAALAAQRAQICAQCPQNVHWETPCAPCNDNIRIRTQNAKGSLATPYDRNLFVCRVFGHMNEVAVWLSALNSTPQSQPPAVCWNKQNGE